MSAWQPYRPGMTLVGKLVKVAEGQHTEVENVANGRASLLPAGLIGLCELVNPQFAKITFRKEAWENRTKWASITNLTQDNKLAGVFVGYLSSRHLAKIEVEPADPHIRSRSGTAMGTRG